MSMKSKNKLKLTAIAVVLLVLIGCTQEMVDQKRYEPLEKSDLFEDGRSSRPLVKGTVARGKLKLDEHLYTGRKDGQFVTEFPFEITKDVLERGRQRFNIFCGVCHDRTGSGNGIVVQRGFKKPPSYHEQRLVIAPVGYLFWIMSNKFGKMPSYAKQIKVEDRWAIAAYMRTLQLSHRRPLSEAPADEQKRLQELPIVVEEKKPLEKPPADDKTTPGKTTADQKTATEQKKPLKKQD